VVKKRSNDSNQMELNPFVSSMTSVNYFPDNDMSQNDLF